MITIGNYLSTNYTYYTGSTTVTAYGVPFKFDLSTVKKVELIRSNLTGDTMDTLIRAFSIAYCNITGTTPSTAPTVSVTTGGSVNTGAHYYAVTYTIGGYETLLGVASTVVYTTGTTSGTTNLTNIPLGPIGSTQTNIYRTNANGTAYYYIGFVSGGTTTYTDTSADNTTTDAPTSSMCYDFTWSSTLNGVTTPRIQLNDQFNMEVDVLDTSISYDMGYQSSQIINPIQLEYDSVFNLVTTQAFTTSWVVAGSAFSMEGRNVAKCYCSFTVGSLTAARFKIIGRHTAGGTAFPVDVVFDKPNRVYELDDTIATISPYFKTYQLADTATQIFTFEILTDMSISEVEIDIAGIGTMTSSSITIDVVKSYSPTRTTDKLIKAVTTPIYADDSASVDAFGRWRTSSPITRIDSQFIYNTQPLFWQTATSGTGSITHLPNEAMVRMDVGTASGDTVIRQTFQYFRYTSGKSQLILLTGVIGSGVTNCSKKIGLFDRQNGIYFELSGTTINIVLRTFTTGVVTETVVPQSSWNTDKLNGSGKSGYVLDLTKSQIFWIDYEWLGVGRVRTGFNIDGKFQVAHVFNNANNISTVYMTTPHLPLRYEITNLGVTTGAQSLKQICSTVITENGHDEDHGITNVASNGITVISNINARVPILSIRPKATFNGIVNRGTIIPIDLTVYTTQDIYWELVWGGTLGGASFSSVGNDSIVESDVAATTITSGQTVASGVIGASLSAKSVLEKSIFLKLPITLDIDGLNPKNLTVVVQDFSTNANCSATLNFIEFY